MLIVTRKLLKNIKYIILLFYIAIAYIILGFSNISYGIHIKEEPIIENIKITTKYQHMVYHFKFSDDFKAIYKTSINTINNIIWEDVYPLENSITLQHIEKKNIFEANNNLYVFIKGLDINNQYKSILYKADLQFNSHYIIYNLANVPLTDETEIDFIEYIDNKILVSTKNNISKNFYYLDPTYIFLPHNVKSTDPI